MPKNPNHTSVPTTDVPRLTQLQKEALSIIMRMSDEQVQKLMHEFADTEISLTHPA